MKPALTQEQLYELVTDGLATTFRLDRARIVPEARLYEDLDIDSIDAVDLAARLQRETGARLSPEVFKAVRTVEDLVVALDGLLNRIGIPVGGDAEGVPDPSRR